MGGRTIPLPDRTLEVDATPLCLLLVQVGGGLYLDGEANFPFGECLYLDHLRLDRLSIFDFNHDMWKLLVFKLLSLLLECCRSAVLVAEQTVLQVSFLSVILVLQDRWGDGGYIDILEAMFV